MHHVVRGCRRGEKGRVALAGRKPRRISAAAGRLASVFTESRGGGHLVAFTTVRGFLSPFFSLSFPDGGGMGGRWTPVEKLLSSAFKKGQGRREGGRLSRSWRSRVNISGQGWARSSFSFAISEITRMRVRTIRFMHLNG